MWVFLALASGFFQSIRNAASKTVSVRYSAYTVTFIRFFYGLPFVLVYLAVLWLMGYSFGSLTLPWAVLVAGAAVCQVLANTFLIMSFRRKNFLTAVNLSKADNLLAALVGATIFGQAVSPLGWVAIVIAVIGVWWAAVPPDATKKRTDTAGVFRRIFRDPGNVDGVLSAVFFMITNFCVYYANRAFAGGDVIPNSAVTLLFVLLLQSALLGLFIAVRNPKDFRIMRTNVRTDFLVGFASALGSLCWFLAFSLQKVAYVRTVGQVEMLFTIMASFLIFREKVRSNEIVGAALNVAGIVLLAMAG